MKKLLILLSVIGLVFCDKSSSSEEISSDELLDVVKYFFGEYNSTKFKEFCPNLMENLDSAGKEVSKCVNNINETSETICSMSKKFTKVCIRPIAKVFEDCLPNESKDLPSFLVDSMVSLIDYICQINGEHILELLNPCIYTTDLKVKCEDDLMEKSKKVIEGFDKETPVFSNKTTICEIVTKGRSCFKQSIESSCHNPKTKEASLGIYDAIIAPCNE